MSEKLVTIATYDHAEEAHLHRALLESEGTWSFVADDYVVTANWLYSTAIGGVKLKVRESDAEKASQILQSVRQKIIEPAESKEECCPICHSSDIHYEKFSSRFFFISWLLLSIPLPLFKRKWRCNACGYEWKQGGN